jgi:hypothetical protein
MAEPTSVTARPIKSGIGYVRIAFFPVVGGQRFARELDRALVTVQDCSRLIFDLRRWRRPRTAIRFRSILISQARWSIQMSGGTCHDRRRRERSSTRYRPDSFKRSAFACCRDATSTGGTLQRVVALLW